MCEYSNQRPVEFTTTNFADGLIETDLGLGHSYPKQKPDQPNSSLS
jgi:hypothetical protein